MDRTTLNLLTRDGAMAVTFSPALTSAQYVELYDVVLDAATADEMAAAVKLAASRWGAEVVVELPIHAAMRKPAGDAAKRR